MKLAKFKLIAGGIGGISITCTEYIMGTNNVMFSDDVTRTRKVPFPHKFRQSITKLKYYFLVLTGHWIEPFNKYYDRTIHRVTPLPETGAVPMGLTLLKEIMNKVNITGVVFTGKGFLITGTIDSYGDKTIGLSTRLVTEEDDAGFYNEALGVINSIFSDVGLFFKEGKVIEDSPRSYLEDLGYSDKENLGELSEEELTNRVLDAFQQRGGIVLMPADGDNLPELDTPGNNTIKGIGNKDAKTTLNTRTGNIDGKNLQEVSEKIDPEKKVEEFKNEKINKEKHPDVKKDIVSKDKKETNDREFPPDNISDEDIKTAIEPVANETTEEVILPTKVKKKKAGSSLASEKDFAVATGEEVKDTVPVDLTNAEFSDGKNPEVDDWSQEPHVDESGLSQEDLDEATKSQ